MTKHAKLALYGLAVIALIVALIAFGSTLNPT